jgi:hypothetical protein
MKHYIHILMATLMFAAQLFAPSAAMAADTSIATLNVSGNVPTIFSVTARGYPGDLDLSGNVSVANRLLGVFHFKYNVDIASLTLQSAQAEGVPSSAVGAGTNYAFGANFTLMFGACTTIEATYKAAFDPRPVLSGGLGLAAGIDIKDPATTAALTAGREEDCNLSASWGGNASNIPLAGKYTLDLTLTMVSI